MKTTTEVKLSKVLVKFNPEKHRSLLVLGAKNIRAELKEAFPNSKFSVRSKSYSMGCNYNISCKSGDVSREEMDNITHKYQYGNFNGMIDCYEYSSSDFTDIYGGAKFVFVN